MAFHLWTISEIYSNASGTIQFIELSTTAPSENFIGGQTISFTPTGGSAVNYVVPGNLPGGSTSGKSILFATAGFAALGIVTPDYIIPDGFLSVTGGALNVFRVDSITYTNGQLPTDGTNSLYDTNSAPFVSNLVAGVNFPKNFAGNTGTISGTNVINGTDGPDNLAGTTAADSISGGAGNDTLSGGDGNDTLLGGIGNDTLLGGLGDDSMDGGDGTDAASYAGASAGVFIALFSQVQNNESVGNDTLTNIEDLIGSDFDDTLLGNGSTNNHLVGGAGNDVLAGFGGADTAVGGTGDDSYEIDSTSDVVIENANEGVDTVIVQAAITYTLAANIENGDVGGFVAHITGNDLDNSIFESSATVLIMDNIFNGGAGNDTMVYKFSSNGPVTVSLALQGAAQNTVGAGIDTLGGFENLTGSDFGDTLTGDSGANTLRGEIGNDTVGGGPGNDTLDGGAGTDTAVFSGSFAQYAFVSYLGATHVADRIASRDDADRLISIEQLQFNGDGSTHAMGSVHTFTPLEYIASYGDLMNAFGADAAAGFSHFVDFGRFEGRAASFDALEYIASYGDLINAFGANADAGAAHYISFGRSEGRNTTFDGLEYIASYGDLVNAFGANSDAGATHYIQFGKNEGRLITFDGLEYIASYGDLINAFGANAQAGAAHYIQFGGNEGRQTTFDGLEYIASYGDLIQAFGVNADAGATHFIQFGVNEGRTEHFNPAQYLANYADLQAAFGSNTELATVHFIGHGYYEGRTDQPLS